MDGGDGVVVVAQQNELTPTSVKSDRASNRGTEPSKNLHGRQIVPDDPNAVKIAPPDGGGIFEQVKPNGLNRAGIRGRNRDLDPAAALVREVLDDGLAGHGRHGECRTLRGEADSPSVEGQGESNDEGEAERQRAHHREG